MASGPTPSATGEATTQASPPAGIVVVLRPLGLALPLGLVGLAIASFVLSGLDLGWIAPAQGKQVGIVILATATPLQAIATVLAFLSRDGASGSAVGLLSGTWLATGVIHVISPPGATSGALGLGLLAAGALLIGSSPSTAASKVLPAVTFALAGVRFVLTGIHELSSSGAWQDAAGIVGLVVAALAAYGVWALELEDALDRPVLPTLRRGPGTTAVGGSLDDQLRGVEHEPGVRRTQ